MKKVFLLTLGFLFSVSHMYAGALQFNDTRNAASILDFVKSHWQKVCTKWYKDKHFYQGLGDDQKYKLKSQKEWYRNDFCGKPDHKLIDDILLAIAKNQSKFLTSFEKNFRDYEHALENLFESERSNKNRGLILYQGHYTKASNLYDFTNAIRRGLLVEGKKLPNLQEDRMVKIFYKEKDWTSWNEWTNASIQQMAENFRTHVIQQEKEGKFNYDAFPVNLSLLSFATSLTSAGIGESPLYFIATDTVLTDANYEGLFLVWLIINGILKDMFGEEEAKKHLEYLKAELDVDSLNKIDNRRVLQFLFNEREISKWGDIGWWSMSHGTVAVNEENRIKTMRDVFENIRQFERDGHFEKKYTYLFNDKDDVSTESERSRSPYSETSSNNSLNASMNSAKGDSLVREQTFSFMDEARTIETYIPSLDKTVPLVYRIQIRIPFNMIEASKYMESLPIMKDENFALSTAQERQKLKTAISIIANRFICLLADKAYYNENLKGWVSKNSVPNKEKWEIFQESFPYFSGKVANGTICHHEYLNTKKLRSQGGKTHVDQRDSEWKTGTTYNERRRLRKMEGY